MRDNVFAENLRRRYSFGPDDFQLLHEAADRIERLVDVAEAASNVHSWLENCAFWTEDDEELRATVATLDAALARLSAADAHQEEGKG